MVKHTQTIRRQQPKIFLSVFDHFLGLAFEGLSFVRPDSSCTLDIYPFLLNFLWFTLLFIFARLYFTKLDLDFEKEFSSRSFLFTIYKGFLRRGILLKTMILKFLNIWIVILFLRLFSHVISLFFTDNFLSFWICQASCQILEWSNLRMH